MLFKLDLIFCRDETLRLKEQALIKKLENDWIEALKRYEAVQKVWEIF